MFSCIFPILNSCSATESASCSDFSSRPASNVSLGRLVSSHFFFCAKENERKHSQQSPSVKTVLPRIVQQDIGEGWRFPACVTPRVVIAGLNQRLSERHCACCPKHPCPPPHPRKGGSMSQEGGCFPCLGLCQMPEEVRGFFALEHVTLFVCQDCCFLVSI